MDTSFEKSVNYTDEWYTPQEVINKLGVFDLDPCAPVSPLFPTAKKMYNKQDDGLMQKWEGKVWLNPPYSRPLIEQFIKKMVEHNNGIALLFNRCDNKMFHELIFPNMAGILFLKSRIKFLRPDGTQGSSPGCGSVLIAFGEKNAEILKKCGLEGSYLEPLRRI